MSTDVVCSNVVDFIVVAAVGFLFYNVDLSDLSCCAIITLRKREHVALP